MQHERKRRLPEFITRDIEPLLNLREQPESHRSPAIELPCRLVEVWYGAIDRFVPQLASLIPVLDDEERAQAARYQFDRHRERFAVRRALLRHILSQYTGVHPEQLEFHRSEFGKPALRQPLEHGSLHFSTSHSNGVALFAVGREGEIGADVEAVRPLTDLDAMIARCLSNSEKAELGRRTQSDRLRDFFHYWTCKEAVIKGTGEGLTRPLESVQISLAEPASPRVVGRGPELQHLCEWRLASFIPQTGFVAAIATNDASANLRLIQF